MTLTQHIAKHLRDVHFGGNWTTVNLKDVLSDVTWQEAMTQVRTFNTILTLVCHTNYYVVELSKFLKGEPLTSKDELSFSHPPIESQEEWEALQEKVWADAEGFALLIEALPESRLWETFVAEQYGTYYRNLHGIVEHFHYHLGQMVLIKKMLREEGGE